MKNPQYRAKMSVQPPPSLIWSHPVPTVQPENLGRSRDPSRTPHTSRATLMLHFRTVCRERHRHARLLQHLVDPETFTIIFPASHPWVILIIRLFYATKPD